MVPRAGLSERASWRRRRVRTLRWRLRSASNGTEKLSHSRKRSCQPRQAYHSVTLGRCGKVDIAASGTQQDVPRRRGSGSPHDSDPVPSAIAQVGYEEGGSMWLTVTPDTATPEQALAEFAGKNAYRRTWRVRGKRELVLDVNDSRSHGEEMLRPSLGRPYHRTGRVVRGCSSRARARTRRAPRSRAGRSRPLRRLTPCRPAGSMVDAAQWSWTADPAEQLVASRAARQSLRSRHRHVLVLQRAGELCRLRASRPLRRGDWAGPGGEQAARARDWARRFRVLRRFRPELTRRLSYRRAA